MENRMQKWKIGKVIINPWAIVYLVVSVAIIVGIDHWVF